MCAAVCVPAEDVRCYIDQIEVPPSLWLLGYTGNNHSIKTPNIQRLAAEGVAFPLWHVSAEPPRQQRLSCSTSVHTECGAVL